MAEVEEFIESVLSHARDSRYDPVKAKEYYERTKELKGRRSASGLKKGDQRERWQYTKDQVRDERKENLTGASENNKKTLIQLRGKAAQRREEVRQKLQAIMEQIGKESKDDRENLEGSIKNRIKALPEMPKGLSKEDRAKFAAERKEEVAKIRDEGFEGRSKITDETSSKREGERDEASSTREQIAEELKGSLDKAKKNYEAARDQIKAKYEAELDTEYEAAKTTSKKKRGGK